MGKLLLDVERKVYYELNEVAVHILKMIERGSTFQELKNTILAFYEVDECEYEADIEKFLEKLLSFDLIVLEEKIAEPIKMIEQSMERKAYHAPDIKPKEEILTVFGQVTPRFEIVHRAEEIY